MRFAIAILATMLVVVSTGCAAVLGLDSGNDVADSTDAEAGIDPPPRDAEADADADAGVAPPPVKDSGSTLTCAPGTANCDGNNMNGCEQMLNDPHHCGSCTTVCSVTQMCSPTALACCVMQNQFCGKAGDCCSGKCNNFKCSGP